MSTTPGWDTLVLGGTVLTMEPDCDPIPDGAVAVSGSEIVAVGPAEELLDSEPTGDVVEAGNCIIMPGLISTHGHLAMSLLRGIADDLPLKTWLEEHIWPAEGRLMARETVRLGTELAAAEMLLAGVTTATDMYFFDDEVGKVLAEAGMRGVVAESVIDFPTPRCDTVDEMIDKQRELAEMFREHPLITPAIGAHSPYTVSASNLVREAELAEELDIPLHIHLSETLWEVEKLLEEKNASPVAYLAELGVLTERTVAAHCVHVSSEDIAILAELGVGVAHNPVSNLKLGSGIAPVPAMIDAGVSVGLATDGPASNNTLDVLRDLQLTALLHKGVTGDPTVLPAETALRMATVDAARVLGLEETIGTLTEGKQADLVCISTEPVNAVPMFEPCSHLVYSARAADVRHVMVAGRTVVRKRCVKTLDIDRIREEAREAARGAVG